MGTNFAIFLPPRTHLKLPLKFEVIWAKGKPKLESDGISEGSDVPDKLRNKFQVKLHWGSFLPNTSLEKQRSIEMSFLEKQEMDISFCCEQETFRIGHLGA